MRRRRCTPMPAHVPMHGRCMRAPRLAYGFKTRAGSKTRVCLERLDCLECAPSVSTDVSVSERWLWLAGGRMAMVHGVRACRVCRRVCYLTSWRPGTWRGSVCRVRCGLCELSLAVM